MGAGDQQLITSQPTNFSPNRSSLKSTLISISSPSSTPPTRTKEKPIRQTQTFNLDTIISDLDHLKINHNAFLENPKHQIKKILEKIKAQFEKAPVSSLKEQAITDKFLSLPKKEQENQIYIIEKYKQQFSGDALNIFEAIIKTYNQTVDKKFHLACSQAGVRGVIVKFNTPCKRSIKNKFIDTWNKHKSTIIAIKNKIITIKNNSGSTQKKMLDLDIELILNLCKNMSFFNQNIGYNKNTFIFVSYIMIFVEAAKQETNNSLTRYIKDKFKEHKEKIDDSQWEEYIIKAAELLIQQHLHIKFHQITNLPNCKRNEKVKFKLEMMQSFIIEYLIKQGMYHGRIDINRFLKITQTLVVFIKNLPDNFQILSQGYDFEANQSYLTNNLPRRSAIETIKYCFIMFFIKIAHLFDWIAGQPFQYPHIHTKEARRSDVLFSHKKFIDALRQTSTLSNSDIESHHTSRNTI